MRYPRGYPRGIFKKLHRKQFLDPFAGHDIDVRALAGRRDDERPAAAVVDDVVLLALIDRTGVLIEPDEVRHIVRREREDETVLARVDDRGRLAGQFLRAHKVLDVLRDDDLHAVVLTDTLRQLEHEIEGDRELLVDEHVRLVDDDHDLAVRLIGHVVLAVLDDLVVQPLQDEQHLGVRDRPVLVGEQGLEVEHDEVLGRRDGRGSVPEL